MSSHPGGRRSARRPRAPTLAQRCAISGDWPSANLHGTLIPIDREGGRADRRHYGKHHRHGFNGQVIADPLGRLIWVSPALAGAVHNIKAARSHTGILDALASAP